MSKPCNGHPSHSLWNVALWFGNDEGLYSLAKDAMRRRTKDQAARYIMEYLTEVGTTATPDGTRFTRTNVRYALRGL